MTNFLRRAPSSSCFVNPYYILPFLSVERRRVYESCFDYAIKLNDMNF